MKKLITLIAIALIAITSVHAENIFSAGYKKLFGETIYQYENIEYLECRNLMHVSKSTYSKIDSDEGQCFIVDGKLSDKQMMKLSKLCKSGLKPVTLKVCFTKDGKKTKTVIMRTEEMSFEMFNAVDVIIDEATFRFFKVTDDFIAIWD